MRDTKAPEPVTPRTEKLLKEYFSGGPFDPNTKAEDFRRGMDAYIQAADEDYQKTVACKAPSLFPLFTTPLRKEERLIEGVKVRCYWPSEEKSLAVILYFTGSGFIHSSLEFQKRNCEDLARNTGCLVINVEVRNAPEHPFPAALEDGFTVLKWISENGQSIGVDPENIGLCGFSSGGNMAAGLAFKARDAGIRVKHQVLISPWLDLTQTSPSYEKFGHCYGTQPDVFNWFIQQYVPHGIPLNHPGVSPFHQTHFQDLASATIIVGGFEAFRDEAVQYADKLRAAQTQATCVVLSKKIHEMGSCFRHSLATEANEDPIFIASESFKKAMKSPVISQEKKLTL